MAAESSTECARTVVRYAVALIREACVQAVLRMFSSASATATSWKLLL